MIVYGSRTKRVKVREQLEKLRGADRLIEFGELEAGVADALCPEMDADLPVLRAFRMRDADAIAAFPLPETVQVGIPEGYAYYALYPEMYRCAALRFLHEQQPERAVVIGIRGIGTSLSAVVASVMAGRLAGSYTVRPRGHPFDRRIVVSPELESAWRARRGAHFLVVDEGPGLSGSSFASVARKLSELGIDDERIVLFPSWEPDAADLKSESARERWQRHRKYTARFEDVVHFDQGFLELSGGKWRDLLCEKQHPAVQPRHERRKYLENTGRLWKFAGLGPYGASKQERAEALAKAGFGPRVEGLENGFLITEFASGMPVSTIDAELLDRIAGYLNYLRDAFPAGAPAPFESLREMIWVNGSEGIGREIDVECFRSVVSDGATTKIDGRMLPHEWLLTPGGYLKTDANDHHDDHFFPGCQDIAWDVAGACVEFGLNRGEQEYLVSRMADATLPRRMPFYRIAYLSYRLGYARMAGDADDGRFRALDLRYGALLREAVA